MQDIFGNEIGGSLWHGIQGDPPSTLKPASEVGGWWRVIDQDLFLNPDFEVEDEDQRRELDAELRTAYGNIVFEALSTSDNTDFRSVAEIHGLAGVGNAVSLVFVTADPAYAQKYGDVIEIDPASDGFMMAIPDDNVHRDYACWLLVFKAGSDFPLAPASAPSPFEI
jgi:hypothetical protein